MHSRAEMDLQLRDLEYKIGAADRKNADTFSELKEQVASLQTRLADESLKAQEND
mgnify:CR=1 FL=1